MTKKELVELLNKNFKDDEEVFVKYEDVARNFLKHHFEIFKDGKWFKWDNKHQRFPSWGIDNKPENCYNIGISQRK